MSSKSAKPVSKTRRTLGYAAYGFVCLLWLAVGTAAGWVKQSPYMMEILRQQVVQEKPKDIFSSNSITLLVLGCDEDRNNKKIVSNAQARSDMMLVAKLDFEHNRVGGVSIPRDLLVSLPGYRLQKINAYHALGGPELARQAAEKVVGTPIDRVMVLNYEAFQDMIDIVGGVEVYVPKAMHYDDNWGDLHIHLEQGRHKLDGYQAMGFIRYRKSDSDFKRMERQRDLMLAFKQAIWSNKSVIPKVTEKAADVMGGAFEPRELAALVTFMQRVKSDQIKLGTVPVIDGSNYNLLLDGASLDKVLIEHYLKEPPFQSVSTTSGGQL